MKLIAVIMLATCMQVSAETYSQSITLSLHNVPLQKVFNEIKKQTGYNFLYAYELMQNAGKVDVTVKNALLQDVMRECLQKAGLTYSIIEKTIVVKEKDLITSPAATVSTTDLPPPPIEIKGKVVNKTGAPLYGASVVVVGTKNGTTTKSDGSFTLTIADRKNIVLEISNVGYQTQTITVNKLSDISVILEDVSAGLDQVVVIGFGTKRRKDLTGAISSVGSTELQKVASSSFTSAIEGKVPGVYITQTSGAPNASSFYVENGD